MKNFKKAVDVSFFVCCAALTAVNAFIDFYADGDSTATKYVGMLLCLIFAVYECFFGGKDSLIVLFAIFFTIIADYFLLVKNDFYEWGVAAFIVAQTAYFIRLIFWQNKRRLLWTAARIIIAAAACIAVAAAQINQTLIYLVAVYASLFLINVIESYTLFCGGIKMKVFAVGLTLFVCCDICVLLYNLGSFVSVGYGEQTAEFFVKLSWIFYLPSQCLIALSSAPDESL